jgi:hypothetical protein
MSSAGSLGAFGWGTTKRAYRAFWAERNRGKALSKGEASADIFGRSFHEDRPDSDS